MSVGYIFPGQGSQQPGMGKELAERFPAARQVFEEADQALGFALSELCFNGPAEDLQLTENTQPAILTTSIAAARAMATEGFVPPSFVAGHSLGEYSALVTAGSLSLAEAVKTVRARGRYMQEAVPVGTGAMAAILGAELAVVESACADAAEGQVCSPANINSPNQIVIAGNTAAVDRAIAILKERGAKRAIKLNVSAPFHCELMRPAEVRLASDLAAISIQNAQPPVITNVDAAAVEDGRQLRESLVRQVSQPVRWLESVEFLISQGVQTLIEVGPGKVLSGLVRQIDRNLRCVNVEDEASLRAAQEALAA